MRKFATHAFVAAFLASSFAVSTGAVADCGPGHSKKTADTSTSDNTSVADSSSSQSAKPASGN
jgi:hypothetical protein